MMLTVRELDRKDLRYLFCSDPRLRDEVDAVNRSLRRLNETVAMSTYTEPGAEPAGKAVNA